MTIEDRLLRAMTFAMLAALASFAYTVIKLAEVMER